MAASVGDDPTRCAAVNGGRMVLASTEGMHAVRDPSVVGPDYEAANGVIRHGHVFALTQAEHAALRGAGLSSVSVRTPPATTVYAAGRPSIRRASWSRPPTPTA
ncbi:hypothetical protein JOL79_28525 [Microbispora sp. RL4-1S]|uniref:Uncharacterized protein n=1 Tax=Microbispora oryzae TaxID=2806554 RepID=A0A940WLB0_9ACTN|nr:hypothetical protein [Microbispora oryzae]MBP2707735.1 hypothetical protein [Microbispora oryzae]